MRLFLFSLLFGLSLSAFAQPSISGFSPTHGVMGTVVTITGTNFNTSSSANVVFFGGAIATVTSASSTSLTVSVPAGANYGGITVVNTGTGLSTSSKSYFTPTYSPGKGAAIAITDFDTKVENYGAGAIANRALMGDIDGDGKPDLVTTNAVFGNFISVYRNTSTTGSISFAAANIFLGANVMTDIELADLDGDGKLDITLAADVVNEIRILRNTSTVGAINFSSYVNFNSGLHPLAVAVSDIDGDGRPDIIAPDYNNGFIRIYRNLSSPGSLSFTSSAALNTGAFPTAVAVGDLDGDGKPEVANVSENSTITIWRNNATAGTILNSSFLFGGTFSVGAIPNSLLMGDLDGDSKLDLLSGSNNLGLLSVLRNTSSVGTISFAAHTTFNSPLLTKPVLSDINGDGKLDIVMADTYTNTIALYTNTSTFGTLNSSSFASKINLPASNGPAAVVACDMDADGKPDLITANPQGPSYSIHRNITSPMPSSGNSLQFDGVDDHVSLPNSLCTALTAGGTNALTIEYWFRGSSLQSAVRIQDGGGYIVAGWNNLHIISSDGGTSAGIQVGANATDGKWHHVAMTWQRNAVNGFKSYLDGQLVDQRNSADVALPSVVSNGYLGAFLGSGDYINGSLDEVRIYTSALSQANIKADMLSTSISVPGSLLAHYTFDHGIASSNNIGINYLLDASGNGYHSSTNNLALNGSGSNWIESYAMVVPTATAASALSSSSFIANWNAPSIGTVDHYILDVSTQSNFSSFVSGFNSVNVSGTSALVYGLSPNTTYYYRVRANKTSVTLQGCFSETITATTTAPPLPPGNALHFDGQNDYVALPSGLIQSVSASNELTISFFFKGSEFQNAVRFEIQYLANVIIAGLKNQNNYTHFIGYLNNGFLSAGNNITDNNWHHIALTFKVGEINGFKSYLDGRLVGQVNAPNFMPSFQGMGGFLGARYGNSEFMNGSLDEMRFYNKVLTQAEIQTEMTGITSVAPSNLLAYYNFDSGIADGDNTGNVILLDQSVNGHHAGLGNFGLNGTTSNWVESYAMVIPMATAASNVVGSGFTANWTVPNYGIVSNYIVDVAKDSNFTQPISGSPFTTNNNYVDISGYQLDTFYYRVRAQKSSLSGLGVWSNTISVIAGTPPPAAPVSGGNITACDNSTIPSLNVTVAPNCTVDWYTAPTGGSPLLTGNTSYNAGLTVPGSYTFYAEARDNITTYVSTSRTAITLKIIKTQFEITEIACSPFTWINTTYSSSGVYTNSYTSSSGCDSTHVLNLTMDPVSMPSITGTSIICQGSATTLSTTNQSGMNYCWKNSANTPLWQNVGIPSSIGSSYETNYPFDLAVYNNLPYVAFIDLNDGRKIKASKYNGTSWESIGSTVVNTVAYALQLSMLGSTPYIIYSDSSFGFKLSVKKFNGSTWEFVGQPNFTPGFASYPNIAFNNGIPYVAFLDATVSKATVMRLVNNNWELVGTPFSGTTSLSYINLKFNGNTPYVAYCDNGSGFKASVRKFDGTNWVYEGSALFTPGSAQFLSFAINNGTPYLGFRDGGNSNKLSVMKFNGTNWEQVGPAGFTTGNSPYTNLSFYNNTPYVSFTEASTTNKATVMSFDGTNWVTIGNPAFTNAAAISSRFVMNGAVPTLIYVDVTNNKAVTVMEYAIPCASNTNSLSVNAASNYMVTVSNANGCSSTNSVTISSKPAPAIPVITATGPTTVCQGNTVPLSATVAGNGIALNGSNQYMITPDLANGFPSSSMTLELWFKANAAGVIVTELGQNAINTAYHDSQLEILANGLVKARVWNLPSIDLGTVSFGTWHHAVIRYNANTSTMDGLLDGVASGTISGSRFVPSNLYYAFGAEDFTNLGSGAYFNGQLDEIRIWNTARTNSEINQYREQSVPVNSTNLVAYYKLDENSGALAMDATSNNYHASAINSPNWIITSGSTFGGTYLWSNGSIGTSTLAAFNGNYTVGITNEHGCTSVSSPFTVTVLPCTTDLPLKLFIQGYYAGGQMMQPVLQNQGVGSSSTLADSIQVSLHQSTAPYAQVATTTCALQTDGTALAPFSNSLSGNYYVVIQSRNGIQIWSSNTIAIPSSTTYDFSTAANKAFGDNQTQIDNNVWAIYSGDINQDETVDAFDYLQLDPDVIMGSSGYLSTDLTGDGTVDSFDYILLDSNLINGISVIKP
jgi:hypothetical protein